MVGDVREHMAQVSFWIDAVQFGGADQRVHGGSALAAAVDPHEQEIFRPRVSPRSARSAALLSISAMP